MKHAEIKTLVKRQEADFCLIWENVTQTIKNKRESFFLRERLARTFITLISLVWFLNEDLCLKINFLITPNALDRADSHAQ